MSTLIAKSVGSLDELYSKKCIDWNFEFKKHHKEKNSDPDYLVILHVIEDQRYPPEAAGKAEKGYDEVFGPPMEYDGGPPDLSRTRTDQVTHWFKLLPVYAAKVQVLKIEGLSLKGDKMAFVEYDMLNPADAGKLAEMLDYSSSIYTYDAERVFAVMRRVFDDQALATGHQKETGKVDLAALRYVRQAPWFFSEGDMIHWRHRCRDIRSTFPTKKYNRDITVHQLVANHVASEGDMDARGGVFVAYQAVMMTFINRVEWDHVTLAY